MKFNSVEVEEMRGTKIKIGECIASIEKTSRGFVAYFGCHGDREEPVFRYSRAFKTRVEALLFLEVQTLKLERMENA